MSDVDCELLMRAWFTTTAGATQECLHETAIREIAQVLLRDSKVLWSRIPRIYSVLRIINQIEAIEHFLKEDISDSWFPFSHKNLPHSFQSQSARQAFLTAQHLVFNAGAIGLEGRSTGHCHFDDTSAVPLKKTGELGKGGFGSVDRVLSTVTHREYARKLIPRGRTFKKDREVLLAFEKELSSLKKLSQHRHIVELVGSYTDQKYVGIITSPVADCNLHEYLARELDEGSRSFIRTFFGCLTSAVCFLHNNSFRHKDIKPQNVLVHGSQVFLTDFGLALDWSDSDHSITTGPSWSTPRYCAPEVAEHAPRGTSADIWSLGCIFLEMWSVLRNETLQALNNHMTTTGSLSASYCSNTAAINSWIENVKNRQGAAVDMAPTTWIANMLLHDRATRWSAHTLRDHIHELSDDPTAKFAFVGSCCLDEDDSDEDVTLPGKATHNDTFDHSLARRASKMSVAKCNKAESSALYSTGLPNRSQTVKSSPAADKKKMSKPGNASLRRELVSHSALKSQGGQLMRSKSDSGSSDAHSEITIIGSSISAQKVPGSPDTIYSLGPHGSTLRTQGTVIVKAQSGHKIEARRNDAMTESMNLRKPALKAAKRALNCKVQKTQHPVWAEPSLEPLALFDGTAHTGMTLPRPLSFHQADQSTLSVLQQHTTCFPDTQVNDGQPSHPSAALALRGVKEQRNVAPPSQISRNVDMQDRSIASDLSFTKNLSKGPQIPLRTGTLTVTQRPLIMQPDNRLAGNICHIPDCAECKLSNEEEHFRRPEPTRQVSLPVRRSSEKPSLLQYTPSPPSETTQSKKSGGREGALRQNRSKSSLNLNFGLSDEAQLAQRVHSYGRQDDTARPASLGRGIPHVVQSAYGRPPISLYDTRIRLSEPSGYPTPVPYSEKQVRFLLSQDRASIEPASTAPRRARSVPQYHGEGSTIFQSDSQRVSPYHASVPQRARTIPRYHGQPSVTIETGRTRPRSAMRPPRPLNFYSDEYSPSVMRALDVPPVPPPVSYASQGPRTIRNSTSRFIDDINGSEEGRSNTRAARLGGAGEYERGGYYH